MEKIQKMLVESTHGQLREFARLILKEYFFTSDSDQINTMKQYQDACFSKKFKIVDPVQLRERFIFCLQQQYIAQRQSVNFSTANFDEKGRQSHFMFD